MPRAGRRTFRLLVGAVAGLLLLMTGAPSAQAHAYLEGSNPADGTTLTAAPHELRLSFSEHVVLSATRISVTDGDGRAVPVTGLRLFHDSEDIEEPAQVVATLPALPRNTYRVSWETLSSDDLHRTTGLFVFGVRTQVAATPFRESRPPAVESLLRALLFAGLALCLGGLLARRSLAGVPGGSGAVARRALVRLATAGAVAALLASLLLPLTQVVTGRAGADQVLGGSWGARWLLRELGLVLLLVATTRVSRERAHSRVTVTLLATGVVLAAVGSALLGHAAAGARMEPLRVAAVAAHLVAALTWAGAVAGLAVVLVGLRVSPRLRVPPLRAALRGFAAPAAACVSVMAVTGVYLASDVVVSVDAVIGTFYGRTLLVKLALVVVACCLALVNHRRLAGRRDLDLPRRTVAAEAVAALLVVAATAVLTSGQPATEPRFVDAAPATTGPLARQVQDLQESLDIRPNRPGDATAVVDVFDTRRPAPGPVTGVSVRVGHGPAVAASPAGEGHWLAPLHDLATGPGRVHVVVTRSGSATVAGDYPWTVAPPSGTPAAVVSRAPLHSVLASLAGLLGLVMAAAWLTVLLRSRRRTRRLEHDETGSDRPAAEVATSPAVR